MDSSGAPDLISRLSDCLLVLIVSKLIFKDALKTSALSSRWRNICLETSNVSFKESLFVPLNVADSEDTRRAAFVSYVVDWLSNFCGERIETFEFSLSKTDGFETQINWVIEFVVSKKVKNLILDFSNPHWLFRENAEPVEASMFQLPECVYTLENLETLKLCFCGFDPSKLAHLGALKSVCFVFMKLEKIMSLLSRTPLLETLRMKHCWNVGLQAITGFNDRLTRLVFKGCRFAVEITTLELPKIEIFKYTGSVHYFEFVKVNRNMEEAHLDLREEFDFDDETGTQLCGLLYHFLSAKTLTICHFLIQMIQYGEDPVRLQAPLETRQLVMKTNLQPNEFVGIRLMLNSCPQLETLSLHIVGRMIIPDLAPAEIDPDTYWSQRIRHKCLRRTLKFVEIWNFTGATYELHVLQYLMRYGRVLERIDIYLPSGVEEGQRILAQAAAETVGTTFQSVSEGLTIYLHSG